MMILKNYEYTQHLNILSMFIIERIITIMN